MSKPVVRIVLAVLIGIGILAAVAPSVQARLADVLPNAQQVANGQPAERTGISARGDAYSYFQYYESDSFHGGCDEYDSSVDD